MNAILERTGGVELGDAEAMLLAERSLTAELMPLLADPRRESEVANIIQGGLLAYEANREEGPPGWGFIAYPALVVAFAGFAMGAWVTWLAIG